MGLIEYCAAYILFAVVNGWTRLFVLTADEPLSLQASEMIRSLFLVKPNC